MGHLIRGIQCLVQPKPNNDSWNSSKAKSTNYFFLLYYITNIYRKPDVALLNTLRKINLQKGI